MKQLPGDSSAEPQEPPSPWWHLHKWAPVHLAVLGVSLLVLLGVVIARIDVYEWRKHHVPQADYETFQYPCQAAGQKLLLYCWPGAPVDVRIEGVAKHSILGGRFHRPEELTVACVHPPTRPAVPLVNGRENRLPHKHSAGRAPPRYTRLPVVRAQVSRLCASLPAFVCVLTSRVAVLLLCHQVE